MRVGISRELKRNKIGARYLPDSAHKLYQCRYSGRPRKINPDTALYLIYAINLWQGGALSKSAEG
jgi:IS30 family transposase